MTHAPARATSITLSAGLTESTEGSVLFGDLVFDPTPYEPRFPEPKTALTRPAPSAKFVPGRYFRIERRHER